jgi:hypothetical protein
MRDIKTAAISNYITQDGKVEVFLENDGEFIKFKIDTGLAPANIQTVSSKPTEAVEMGLKTVKYCDSSGTEYEMYIIASDAWESTG